MNHRFETRRGLLAGGAALATASWLPLEALAQQASFPNRPLRLVSGFAPGGATDVVARVIAQSLTDAFGQSVVVENRPGAAGNIAAEYVARSAPDGHVLYLNNATIAMPSMFPKLTFDVKKDLAPVVLIAYGPSILAVNPKLPVRSVRELIDYARRNPGKLDYASGGIGNITHMAMELFLSMAKVQIKHVPYKGGAPSTTAVVGGEVPILMSAITSTLGHIKQGTLVPLAVTGSERTKALPDVPTIAEAGLPGYQASSWYGALAPAGTPQPIIDKLNKAIVEGMQRAEQRERLIAQGMDPAGGPPEAYTRLIHSEIDKWAAIIASAGITAE
ncbi:tripartite tricarboxylate transporter substrate binding protein [Hydrogenophaga sp. 2FB]|uniref:tripartite tricarboxylate transporter substrate binding protein n=1 Tax=Hydrogenophaga sp. 2FB TaxID=2502187 RepID=UPI0014852340|nr:tripartite tricarboxylate transporter substrate binding protein [Hydrogenophaga sp. 2FB]